MSALPAEAIWVAAPSTRRSPPPGRAADAATILLLPVTRLEPPPPPEGGFGCPAAADLAVRISAKIRRPGCRVRTARSARAHRRPSASSERLPAPLRPTTRRRRSFRGKGLRRAYTAYRLTLPIQPPSVRKQWLLFRQTIFPLYLTGLPGPVWLFRSNRKRSSRKRRKICRHEIGRAHV